MDVPGKSPGVVVAQPGCPESMDVFKAFFKLEKNVYSLLTRRQGWLKESCGRGV